jgi:dsDNA-specific endonuclease/ATPase MutS2
MAQSGIPVPADNSSVFLAGRLLADIGDDQSIEESPSTSRHIGKSRKLERADQRTVVLLDEPVPVPTYREGQLPAQRLPTS